jgi:hypothetical protein
MIVQHDTSWDSFQALMSSGQRVICTADPHQECGRVPSLRGSGRADKDGSQWTLPRQCSHQRF